MASMAVCSVGSSVEGAAESVLAKPVHEERLYWTKLQSRRYERWCLRRDKDRLMGRAELKEARVRLAFEMYAMPARRAGAAEVAA